MDLDRSEGGCGKREFEKRKEAWEGEMAHDSRDAMKMSFGGVAERDFGALYPKPYRNWFSSSSTC